MRFNLRNSHQGDSVPPNRCAVIVLAAVTVACRPALPRPAFLVTQTPINVGVGPGLCIAIDPNDEHGVWWWEGGASGCSSRSTGPGLFHPEPASVSHPTSETTEVAFRLGTHSSTRPFIDVRLRVEHGQMRAIDTDARVAVQPRSDLDIPEMPPRGGQFAR